MNDDAGKGLRSMVIDRDLLALKELTLLEKMVLAYCEQVEPYEPQGSSCAIFLDISDGDVFRAKAHLYDLGYITGGK